MHWIVAKERTDMEWSSVEYRYLTIILRNRAEYRLILSWRGRWPSRLKSGDIPQDWAGKLFYYSNKLITKLTTLSGQKKKNSFIYSLACCGVQNYVYRRISVTYGWQILRKSWAYLDSVTICWIVIQDMRDSRFVVVACVWEHSPCTSKLNGKSRVTKPLPVGLFK